MKPFDCGNSDLNDFLLNDAKAYASHLLAVTYLLEDDNELSFLISEIFHKNIDFYGIDSEKIMIFSEFNTFCVYLQRH